MSYTWQTIQNLHSLCFLSAEISHATPATSVEKSRPVALVVTLEGLRLECYQVSHANSHANQFVLQLLLQDHWQRAHQLTGHHLSCHKKMLPCLWEKNKCPKAKTIQIIPLHLLVVFVYIWKGSGPEKRMRPAINNCDVSSGRCAAVCFSRDHPPLRP